MEKVALVTGASSGIGKQTALVLNENGYKVYGVARRVDRMKDLEVEGIHTFYMDIQNEVSVEQAVERIIDREGRVDVLVNNAGFGIYGTLEDVPMSEARRQFDVNVFGLAKITQLILPYMRRQGEGRIVNISSIAGRMSMPLGTWYHASKYAVEALSDSLRGEVAKYGIDVILIEPGIINTAWWPIAEHNLENVSQGTDYLELVQAGEHYLKDPGDASDPREVADVILKALRSEVPHTRYKVGENAKKIVLAKELLTDRQFDNAIEKRLQYDKKN